jgi:Zn-dependent protease with chaperone function
MLLPRMARLRVVKALDYFSPEEVERAGRYHRPLYVAFGVDFVVGVVVLAALAFGPPGDRLFGLVDGLPWWAAAPAFAALVVVVTTAIDLPLSFWRGFLHEERWGFSTQSVSGWLADRAKALLVGTVLTSGVLLGFVALARAFPGSWPALAAPGAALVVLFLSFIAPVMLEPMFNRFEPLGDEAMVADLRALAERAGVPVRDVLVADASRRTRKENAYVSGLGKTRRVVVYDTLLGRAEPAEVRLVAAHELGHRRMRHVAWWTLIGMAGAAGAVLLLWALLELHPVLRAMGASGPGDPRVVPFVLLVAGALQVIGMPVAAALSRRWESAADRFSLELTADPEAFEESFRALALSNLLDLDPPRAFYLIAFTHPTPPERIAAARRWGAAKGELTSPSPSRPTTES